MFGNVDHLSIFRLEYVSWIEFGVYLDQFVAKIVGPNLITNYEVKAIFHSDAAEDLDISQYVTSNYNQIKTRKPWKLFYAKNNDKYISFWCNTPIANTPIPFMGNNDSNVAYYLKFIVRDKHDTAILIFTLDQMG